MFNLSVVHVAPDAARAAINQIASSYASLAFLYERLVMEGDAQGNWQAALTELNLTMYNHEEIV